MSLKVTAEASTPFSNVFSGGDASAHSVKALPGSRSFKQPCTKQPRRQVPRNGSHRPAFHPSHQTSTPCCVQTSCKGTGLRLGQKKGENMPPCPPSHSPGPLKHLLRGIRAPSLHRRKASLGHDTGRSKPKNHRTLGPWV